MAHDHRMALLRVTNVGKAPVDVSAGLDGRLTIENLGTAPLTFVVAEAAGEAAPADRRGHLLRPGKRETLQVASGAPVWAWSPDATRTGVSAAIAGDTGVGGGGGLRLLAAGTGVTGPTLSGQYAIGATVLTLLATPAEMAAIRVGHRARIGPEFHRITAVDEASRQVTIADPGLLQANVNGPFSTALLYGEDDVLQLPDPAGGGYTHLDVRFLYETRRTTGQPGPYGGRCAGGYFSPGASWYESLQDPNYYWFAGGNTDEGLASYTVGVIHALNTIANAWGLQFDPATNRLFFLNIDGNASNYMPRLSELVVAGA